MHASAIHPDRSTSIASCVASLSVDEFDHDGTRVSIPRAEVQLVVRFGPMVRGGLDVHALGGRLKAHRKLIHRGHRAIMARLHLGASQALLGVSAPELAGRIVPLDELWGEAATRMLCDRLAGARDAVEASAVLERALAERLSLAGGRRGHVRLALEAADRLASAQVNEVAADLAVSERHLRRVFRDVVGVSPKSFAKLARFHRALHAARVIRPASWASIAVASGYYDQAHLIEEFRAIAGVTPRALLGELTARAGSPGLAPS